MSNRPSSGAIRPRLAVDPRACVVPDITSAHNESDPVFLLHLPTPWGRLTPPLPVGPVLTAPPRGAGSHLPTPWGGRRRRGAPPGGGLPSPPRGKVGGVGPRPVGRSRLPTPWGGRRRLRRRRVGSSR